MSVLIRIFVIAFAFLVASFVAGMIIVIAVLFPDISDVRLGLNDGSLAVIGTIGFVFVSGFALLPALVAVLITEGFAIRSVLFYALSGAIVGAICYFGIADFRFETMNFSGFVRREMEVMTGAGIVAGLIYWAIAGRKAGSWRSRGFS